jgi:hypothetical protein
MMMIVGLNSKSIDSNQDDRFDKKRLKQSKETNRFETNNDTDADHHSDGDGGGAGKERERERERGRTRE